jgi:two-component system, chemotaxis family, chemotaxis protein CheY
MVVWGESASRPPGVPPAGDRRAASGPSRARRRPILVVDDDPEIVAMLRDFLESEGHTVHTAANGAEALERLADVRPSVILLDMRMPVLDGWGFAKRLQERQERYPIVVMTAAESAQRWADEIGANGYIAKPFDLDELLQKIERHRAPNGS